MKSLTRRGALAGIGCLACAPALAAPREITIPISSLSFATAGIRIAKELGLFEKHGLSARIVTMDSGNAATSALISRSVEVVLSGPGELVAARARGQRIVAIADAYRGLSASLLLSTEAAEKSGIGAGASVAARLKALDGLTIAAPSATSSYTVSFKGAAEDQRARIKFTYMAQPAMVAALETGAIQGFIAGAPFWGVPVAKGRAVLWLSGPKAELPRRNMPVSTVSLQAMSDVADADPELMRKLQAVIADLGAAVDQRPGDVRAALVKLYPEVDERTMDLLFGTESSAWKTRPFTPEDMRHEIAFVKSTEASLPQIDSIELSEMIFTPK